MISAPHTCGAVLLSSSFFSPSTSFACDNITGSLVENIAYIKEKNSQKLIYKSLSEYNVKEIFCDDFNNDGKNEVAFSLWKKGNYGSSKPFWVKGNDDSYRMHFFLYKIGENSIKPLWHSSNLKSENIKIWPIKNVKNNRTAFLTFEKNYSCNSNLDCGYNFKIWMWKSWGFELVDELLK